MIDSHYKGPCSTTSKPETINSICPRHSRKVITARFSSICDLRQEQQPKQAVCLNASLAWWRRNSRNKDWRTSVGIDWYIGSLNLSCMDQEFMLKQPRCYEHTKQSVPLTQMCYHWGMLTLAAFWLHRSDCFQTDFFLKDKNTHCSTEP